MLLYRFPSYCSPITSRSSIPFPDAFKNQIYHYYDFTQDLEEGSSQTQSKLDIARNSVVIPPIPKDSSVHLPIFIQEGLSLHEKYLHLRNDECVNSSLKEDDGSSNLAEVYFFVVLILTRIK